MHHIHTVGRLGGFSWHRVSSSLKDTFLSRGGLVKEVGFVLLLCLFSSFLDAELSLTNSVEVNIDGIVDMLDIVDLLDLSLFEVLSLGDFILWSGLLPLDADLFSFSKLAGGGAFTGVVKVGVDDTLVGEGCFLTFTLDVSIDWGLLSVFNFTSFCLLLVSPYKAFTIASLD